MATETPPTVPPGSPPQTLSPLPDPKRRLLDLGDLISLPSIRVRGKDYGLRTREAMSILEDARAHRLYQRILELESGPSLTDEAVAAEYAATLDQICRLVVLGMSDDEHQALSDYQREHIVVTFSVLRWGTLAEATAGATDRPESPSTSASSSPPSAASTPASTPVDG